MPRLIPLITHTATLALGFALGIYTLPILIAPNSPSQAETTAATPAPIYTASFNRNLKGSDFLHWGEGTIRITAEKIAHQGRLTPGPDYRLYLVPAFVETKDEFLQIKTQSRQIAAIKSFNGFLVDIPPGTDLTAHTTIVIWCETFSQFITAAKYR